MKLLILLHVKSNHQAEMAIDILLKRGAYLPENTPPSSLPLNHARAVGVCHDGRMQIFFKGMDSTLPDADIACHVYEEDLLPAAQRQEIIDKLMMAAHVRALRGKVTGQIKKLSTLSLEDMPLETLTALYASLNTTEQTMAVTSRR